MIYILIFVSQVFAAEQVCEIKIDGKISSEYYAKSCKPGHIRNLEKENGLQMMRQKQTDRKQEFEDLKAQCPTATGLLKDLCEYVTR